MAVLLLHANEAVSREARRRSLDRLRARAGATRRARRRAPGAHPRASAPVAASRPAHARALSVRLAGRSARRIRRGPARVGGGAWDRAVGIHAAPPAGDPAARPRPRGSGGTSAPNVGLPAAGCRPVQCGARRCRRRKHSRPGGASGNTLWILDRADAVIGRYEGKAHRGPPPISPGSGCQTTRSTAKDMHGSPGSGPSSLGSRMSRTGHGATRSPS